MNKLLRANWTRLWKSKEFLICFFSLTGWGIVQRIGISLASGEVHHLENTFWIQALPIGIVLSAFISLFVGEEYAYGTIRNQVISGHTRFNIYLANVLISIIAGWLMCLGCLLSSLLVGIPLQGFFHVALSEILSQGICVFALSAAYAAIYCVFAMLIPNRTITAIICMLLSFSLIFSGKVVADRLDELEYYEIPDSSLGIGEIDDGSHFEWVQNPDYLAGTERRIFEIIFEALPGGQSIQLSGMLDVNVRYAEMFSASFAWIVVSCGCGLILFRKKDLK